MIRLVEGHTGEEVREDAQNDGGTHELKATENRVSAAQGEAPLGRHLERVENRVNNRGAAV